jgi:hypothetical protein
MWFLKGLKGLIASLANWPVAAFGYLRDLIMRRPVVAVLVTLVGSVLFGVLYYKKEPIVDFLNHADETGKILVNSPTVYTRQRLVNDRLDQARWLRMQLLSTEAGHEKEFKNLDSIHRTVSDTQFSAGGENHDHKPDGTANDPPGDRDINVESTTTALFRAKNAYREEVRSEITQTELDDRHDIEGNTIFRLTFDTSVVAGTKKDAVAAVVIRLGHHPESASGAEKDIYSEDYRSLYNEWARYFQENLTKSMQSVPASILSPVPEPHLRLLFTEFLVRRICQFVAGNSELKDDPPDCDTQQRVKAEKLLAQYTKKRGDVVEKDRDNAFESQLSNKLAQYNPLGPAYVSQNLLWAATDFCVQHQANHVYPSDLGVVGPAKEVISPDTKNGSTISQDEGGSVEYSPIDCPYYDSLQERLVSGILLYESVFSVLTQSGDNRDRSPPAAGDYDGYSNRTVGELRDCKSGLGICSIQPSKLRCFVADFLKSNLNGFADRTAEGSPKIDEFLTLRLVGREINDCTILVVPSPKALYDKPKVPVSEMASFLRDTFAKYLNNRTDAFAYSVTPKSLTENIETAAETRDAFEALYHSSGQGDIASFLRKRSQQNRAVIAHPIVVGFGSLDEVEQTSASISAAGVRDIDFGWIIASRMEEDGSLAQIDGQYPLTGFISVPAWWRSVHVSIHTCWLSRSSFAALGPTPSAANLCQGEKTQSDRSPAEVMVRLPPAIPEISHKLGFDVVKQPSIYNPQQQEFVIGEHGSLLLEGQRLWRSTDVTAGTLRAKGIVVLPNMEGILADFGCIEPPRDERPNDRRQDRLAIGTSPMSVRVWTSEGVTDPIPLKFIWQKDWKKRLAECQQKSNQSAGQNVQ